ncbi:molecular chaperone GrpE [Cephaloticoccus primus]|uniref:Protein GrpE n=1 Tax=Cephaloticoccus primus TaxID=1548207 RepID=A0A139SHM5_9BACT|nr:nucleotide exchange factor GrpE [Cephaloticoccus primus]KXU34049.1 molecular chaperone GrpE [Cephaloticoccus primus]
MSRANSEDTEPKTHTTTTADPDVKAEEGAGTPPAEQAQAQSGEGAAPAADPLEAAKAEAAALQDRYLRAVADHENFRKRVAREKDELRQYAASRVLEDLLPVLDNLGLGLAAAAQPGADVKSLREGVAMVQTQLKAALEQHGLKEIDPAGQAFDAHQHEALSQAPSAEVAEGDVLQVIRVGYSLNGRLLRPASVVVSSGAAANSGEGK